MRPGNHGPQEAVVTMENKVFSRNAHQCVACYKTFSAPSKLQRHVLTHTGQRPFGCPLCKKAFRQQSHLKFHLNTHTSDVTALKTGSDLCKSKKVHVEVKGCTLMQNSSSDAVSVQVKSTIHPIAPNDRVKKSWSDQSDSTVCHAVPYTEVEARVDSMDTPKKETHLINLNGTMAHQCPECFKCFSAPSKLKRHCLIHTGQRPFQCTLCCRAFRQLSHLKAHSSVHFAKKRNPLLLRHEFPLLARPGKSPAWPRNYVCRTCGRGFRQMRLLMVHQKIHKSSETSWSINMPTLPNTVNPVLLNSESCFYQIELNGEERPESSHDTSHAGFPCDSLIEKGPDTTVHAPKEHSEPTNPLDFNLFSVPERVHDNQCMMCLKKFDFPSKLSRHLLVHMGMKPFRCRICSRAFRQRSHLQCHQKVHKQKMLKSRAIRIQLPAQSEMTRLMHSSVSEVKRKHSHFVSSRHHKYTGDTSAIDTLQKQCITPNEPPIGPFTSDNLSDSKTQLPASVDHQKVPEHVDIDAVLDPAPAHLSSGQSHFLIGNQPYLHRQRNGYRCPVCSKLFDAPSKLQRHHLTHTGKRTFKCQLCPKMFRQKAHLKTHQSVHRKGGEEERSVCLNAEVHAECVFTQEPVLCSEGATLEGSYNVDKQIKASAQPELNQCPSEGDFLLSQSEIASILNDCSLSEVTENREGSQPAPTMRKERPRGYQCNVCLKMFDFPSKLSRHLLVHMGMKPFRCRICSRAFRQRSHLQCHQKVHEKTTGQGNPHVQPNKRSCFMTEVNHTPSYSESVPEENRIVAAPCSDGTGPGRSCDVPEKTGKCHVGHAGSSTVLDNDSVLSDDCKYLPQKLERTKGMNTVFEANLTTSMACTSPSLKSENSTWNITDDDYVVNAQSEINFQQQNLELENLPSQTLQKETEQHVLLKVQSSQEKYLGYNRESISYQSGRISNSSAEQMVKVETSEVSLRSNLNNVGLSSLEPPSDIHICPGCSLCFTTERQLQQHSCKQKPLEKEKKSNSYKCAICFKDFEAPSKLKRHYVVHTGHRPFQCVACGKAFTQSGHLKTHLLTHR